MENKKRLAYGFGFTLKIHSYDLKREHAITCSHFMINNVKIRFVYPHTQLKTQPQNIRTCVHITQLFAHN
jgi:hypothetical protein